MKIVSKLLGGICVAAGLAGSYIYSNFSYENQTHIYELSFSTGTKVNNADVLKEAYERLISNPNYQLRVVAHTGTIGNPAANLRLSYERSRQVFNDFTGEQPKLGVLQLRKNQVLPTNIGTYEWVGGDSPLPKLENESERAYQNRLSRAEIIIYYGGTNEQS